MKLARLGPAIVLALVLVAWVYPPVQADSSAAEVQLEVEVVSLPLELEAHLTASSGIEVVDWDGDGQWSHNTWYVDLYPGEEASIELKVRFPKDTVVYVEYDIPRDLSVYFDPPAFEIRKNDSKWIEVTVYTPNDIEPDEYYIDFSFRAVPIGTRVVREVVYRNKYLPGSERVRVEYVDRVEYINREVPKYIYVQTQVRRGIDWWWIPISILFTTFFSLSIGEIVRRR